MAKKKVIIQPNANFHHVSGEDIFRPSDEKFKDYRKKWVEWPKHFSVGAFPLFIDIEATSVCNLTCPFCATTFRKKHIPQGFIAFDLVKKIIDEGAARGLCGIKFNIRGEPLLHDQIGDFVAYAKKKGLIDVYFNTNAMLLNLKMAQRLIEAGLDRISISAEGYTKQVYERYRTGSHFETVLKNIEQLQVLKKKRGVDFPKVRIQTVMLPELAADFERYKAFWSERADEVAFLDYKQMKRKKKGLQYPWACSQLWQRMAVWWDGTILPCNHDDAGFLALGNVSNITIQEAWTSKALDQIRFKHQKGLAHEIGSCDGCYLRDSEILKLKSEGQR